MSARRNPLGLSSSELLIVGGGIGLLGLGAVLYFTSKPGNTTPVNTTGNNPVAPIPSATGSTTGDGS